MTKNAFLILHGWGGNKPTHWQEILIQQLSATGAVMRYPKMPDPTAPNLAGWLARLKQELRSIAEELPGVQLTVLAHSLGSITWMHFAAHAGAEGARVADRVLLVAPPYIVPQIPPVDVPDTVTEFFPPPCSPEGLAAVARETVLVASDTDDYATYDQSSGYALKLGVPIHMLKGAGHISPYYGYGEWPWVLEWCLGRADLPPLPRPTE